METYNYLQNEIEDIISYINDNINLSEFNSNEELEDYLNEELFCEDTVTGNGSGSYTFNTYLAKEYLCHNLDLLAEACEEFGSNINYLKNSAEACDVTIRCYLLPQAINEAIEKLNINLD